MGCDWEDMSWEGDWVDWVDWVDVDAPVSRGLSSDMCGLVNDTKTFSLDWTGYL